MVGGDSGLRKEKGGLLAPFSFKIIDYCHPQGCAEYSQSGAM